MTDATVSLGYVVEDRPFRPHLTIARASRPTDLRDAVAALDAAGPGPPWTASEIVLFESDTRPGGAVHTIVAALPLAENDSRLADACRHRSPPTSRAEHHGGELLAVRYS